MTTSYKVAEKTGLLGRVEIDLLKHYISEVHVTSPVVVIIGAGSGTSSLAILEARPSATIFSIDTIFPTGGRYEPGEKANLQAAGLWETGRVIQIIGESQIVGLHWPIQYDFIFIDGDHRYEAVKRDIEVWYRHCNFDGYMFFHDYADKEIKPKAGVKRAVDEFFMDNLSWESTEHRRFTIGFKRVD